MGIPLVVLGATGVGKTQWLIQNFQNRAGVVVNVDSVQVYRHFDIGSAKVTPAECALVPHVMVDIQDPMETLSVNEYIARSIRAIKALTACGKQVIISGGTPYYLKHLLWGAPAVPVVDLAVRKQVADWIALKGGDYAYKALEELDPRATAQFHRRDVYRISRAWEVYYQTGQLLSSFSAKEGGLGGDFNLIGFFRPRPIMWERAYARVRLMMVRGLKQEVQGLRRAGYEKASAMGSIGYREWGGVEESGTAVGIEEAICLHTRQCIKRQMTFFRSFCGVRWFNLEEPKELDSYLGSLSF